MNKKFLNKYKKNGYCIVKGNLKEISYLKTTIINILKKKFKISKKSEVNILPYIHNLVDKNNLNSMRLFIFNEMNKDTFKKKYFNCCKKYLEKIVGNEIVMQKKINLSIQMPSDSSSLLPIHSDTWAGDSPFEVVVWIPLLKVYKTSSMFILPKQVFEKKKFNKVKFTNNDQILVKFKKYVKFLKIDFGDVLLFNQNLPHGNIINNEYFTRWSLNCRFKSLFSPYRDKKFMEFFEPMTKMPATIDGLKYENPNFS